MTIYVKDPLHWNASCIHINGGIAFMHAIKSLYGSPDHFRDFVGKLAYEFIITCTCNVFQSDSITLRDIPSVQVLK